MDIFPYDAVVFDLDGTLFDAEEGIVSSVRRAMDEMGLEVPADADLREVVGPPLADSFRDLLGVPEARVQEAVDRYRRDFSARGMYLYSVYPNIRSILRMLHEAGVHVGLATSKPLRLARDILSYFALDGDFDRIVGEEDAAAKLGKAELIRRALPDRYRQAVYLRYYEGYEPAEIGELMGCTASQVSTYLYRGKAKLRKMLGGAYGQECLSE